MTITDAIRQLRTLGWKVRHESKGQYGIYIPYGKKMPRYKLLCLITGKQLTQFTKDS